MPNVAPNILAHASLDQGQKKVVVRVLAPGASVDGFWICKDTHSTIRNIHYTNLMPIEPLPNRFRRTTFERYAHIIGAALDAYPGAVKVDPSPLQVDSFIQPLRDAITAKQRYRYTHPLVKEELFSKHASSLVVRAGEGLVFIGSNEATRSRKAVAVGRVADTNAPTPLTDFVVDRSHLETLCLLLHQHAFDPVPLYVVHNLPSSTIEDLEARYDVVFAPDAHNPQKHHLIGPLKLNLTPHDKPRS